MTQKKLEAYSRISYGSVNDGVGGSDSDSNDIIAGSDQSTTTTSTSISSSSSKWNKPLILFLVAICAAAPYLTNNSALSSRLDATTLAPDSIMSAIEPTEQIALTRDHTSPPPPFSYLDPVQDLNLYSYDRPKFSSPGLVFSELHAGQKETGQPLPTNKWYEDMLLIPDQQTGPNDSNRVYTVPYLINAIGPIPGIKICATRLLGMEKVVQVTFIDHHGITLGAAKPFGGESVLDGNALETMYQVDYDKEGDSSPNALTPLGLTLKWEANNDTSVLTKMSSSIVRGMPYGTMHYHYSKSDDENDSYASLPTVVSEISCWVPPVTDSGETLKCTKGSNVVKETRVEKSVEISFLESDYTWLVFYSQPVYVRCYETPGATPFVLQVTRLADSEDESNNNPAVPEEVVFTSRVALLNNCTRGANPSHCSLGKASDRSSYGALLKSKADVYPGKHTKIDYTFFSDEEDGGGEYSYLQFDWDARNVRDGSRANSTKDNGLLMYSLPHHREMLKPEASSLNSVKFDGEMHCSPSLNGNACIVDGSRWVLKEDLDGQPSFFAPRPPMASAIPNLARAINQDIEFQVPGYFARGAGDTYFSGKMLAKLARILLISKEVTDICSNASGTGDDYDVQCQKVALPTAEQFSTALAHLRSSTEIWINGTAETPFVFDHKWGGLVSCGCLFNGDTMACDNVFPDCPAFSDPGLDFGHAFYNDHHFHQGYHIYAASTVAFFDADWGKKMFENVLLLIRDIANPSPDDIYFPTYRMKDWYLGNSWAGGIARAYPNGRNQESSSESIAAYEAVSLYGSVMADVWANDTDDETSGKKASVSRHIREVGRLLTSTELRSADRYWHVRQTGPKSGIYPKQYKPLVVGIMWNLMAQFQTWFGNAPHLAYGIQLLPLTPISERRDDIDWAKQLYPSYAESCSTATDCDMEGWGILQHAILAEVGHPELAIKYAEGLPDEAFTSAGGNGHSLTNTIWYYSTRPETKPLVLPSVRTPSPSPQVANNGIVTEEFNCGCPETCTKEVQDYDSVGFTCGARMKWLMKNDGKSEHDACSKVAGVEFTETCAGCDPNRCTAPLVSPAVISHECPPCTMDACKKSKCPVLDAPFMCMNGSNEGGCSMVPWTLGTEGSSNCNTCCQLSYECL